MYDINIENVLKFQLALTFYNIIKISSCKRDHVLKLSLLLIIFSFGNYSKRKN